MNRAYSLPCELGDEWETVFASYLSKSSAGLGIIEHSVAG